VRIRRRWLACAALCAVSGTAIAQSSAHYTLSGTITGLDGAPVADAEVSIMQADVRVRALRSDTAGRFVAADLSAPLLSVHVRRLGYQPKVIDVTIRADDRKSNVVIALDPMPAELNKVSVVAEETDARLRAYEDRKATNSFGHYIDGGTIEKRRPQFLSEMLRTVPGVTVTATRGIGNNVRIRGCAPLVWLDGVRLTRAQLDEVIQPSEVAAMEIYSSFSGIPAQYFDRAATCGTILVWSRSK
jgi:hypothetical protein